MESKDSKQAKTFTEEIEVMGSQLVQQVKDLLNEGNVRQLRIKASDGDIVLETPLTFGVVAGGAVVLAAPWLAILGAIAAFVTHARVEIVRDIEGDSGTPEDKSTSKTKATSKTGAKTAAKPKTTAKAKTTTAKPKAASRSKPAGKTAKS
jgi:hypothetical protein